MDTERGRKVQKQHKKVILIKSNTDLEKDQRRGEERRGYERRGGEKRWRREKRRERHAALIIHHHQLENHLHYS